MHAIRAAHAFDGTQFLSGGATVLLDGDRIAGVETGRWAPPAGVEIVEHDGTLTPGLIDCHTHLVADGTFGSLERAGALSDDDLDAVIEASLRTHASAGVTTVRDLGDRGYRTPAFRERPGLPRVIAAGPPLTSVGGHCHFLGGEVGDDVRAAVREHVDRGVDVIKVMASGGFATPGSDQPGAQFSADELRAMVDEAHRAGLSVLAHAHSLVGIENAVAAGVDGIEHFSGLSPAGVQITDALLDEVARRGIVVDLTMGNDRSLHALMPAPPPAVAAVMARLGVTSFDDFYADRFTLLARLREHGVTVVPGVDLGMVPPKQHGNVWRAIAEMVEAGYTPADALTAGTSTAATVCGVGDRTGQIRPGYAADLLLVDGDLSTDISLLGRPRVVYVRGTRGAVR